MKIDMRAAIISLILFLACSGDQTRERQESNGGPESLPVNVQIDSSNIETFHLDCSIRAIFPVSDAECWFAGSHGKYGYTRDGGKSWRIDSIQHADQPQLQFRSIAKTTDAIFLLSIASPSLLYRSTDNGLTWEIVYQERDSLSFYDSMSFWNDQDGIAMGDPTESCLSVILTSDAGKTWSKIPCDHLPATIPGEAAFAASNSNLALYGDHVWLVSGGAKARVFHSPDKGQSWQVYQTPILEGGRMTGIFSCDFFDRDTGIIIGGDWEDMTVNEGNKALTTNGGKTWEVIAEGQTPGYRSCVQFLSDNSPNSIIAVGIPGISISNDRGKTWEDVSNQSFYTVRKADNVLWFGGANGMARLVL